MSHLRVPYYVGLLTAAAIHGASGQAAQIVQVVTARPRRPVRHGRAAIDFVVRSTAAAAPVHLRTTPSGRMRVGTPEVVALDLVRYPVKAAGWGNVVTVLREVAPWADDDNVEQDLVITLALFDIFRDPLLKEALAFRGGTALHKLHLAPAAARRGSPGYTLGMKTAVSVPDDLFAQVDRLAKRSRRSRSEVYSAALREYVARHAPDEVTAGIDAVLADLGQPDTGEFSRAAARQTLEASEW